MENYLAFYGDIYYPSGGMDDFIGDFETEEKAISFIEQRHKQKRLSDIK